MKTIALTIVYVLAFFACDGGQSANNTTEVAASGSNQQAETAGQGAGEKVVEPAVTAEGPKTIRDFFMLLPEKYFTLEGCDREKDKDCKKAREEYLKQFAEIDIANGYIKGGCDGGQACIEMAIFKRPDSTYLVGVSTFSEMMNDYYFLDHNGGKWKDVSAEAVPEFSKKNMYELPRKGTTVPVFAKKIIEQGADFEASEKGAKLYDLVWKDGKFAIKR
jgi:hypothetical protein